MDYFDARQKIVNQIKNFVGDRNAVIGESGGIDSALITFLCVEAIGPNRVIARTMPYGEQATADADIVASILDIKNYGCVNIKPMVDAFGFTNRMTIGNTKARMRMSILYALAAENNGMVIGTSNKTEMKLGYFTKFGDGGCDVEPIGDLYKTDVWAMAKTYSNFPQGIITKAPSAELWSGQTDESEIGMTYAEMDRILKGLEKIGCPDCYLMKTDLGDTNYKKIVDMYKRTEHKRHMPPTFLI
ncbi:MAG TPA: NAD+ synthase [Methanosarcinales archaeon]|nr:NAD+ synthase [Methanosarcinales archaeon]